MALESSVTNKGAIHWRVYIRHTARGEFRGGESFDLQEAINSATELLRKSMTAQAPQRPSLNLQLNLSALRLK